MLDALNIEFMSVLVSLAVFVALLGGLVFVHELGHFVAAKAFRVKVLKFSLGFGPRVWGFTRGETEYQLAALPLGGYVKMAGEDPTQPLTGADKGRGFNEQSPWKRVIIAFAGPAVNLALPVAVFFAINLSPQQKLPPLVGMVMPNEPADRAGVLPGDLIVSVDGHPTPTFDDMKEVVERRATKRVPIEVVRNGERLTLHLTPTSENVDEQVEIAQKGRIGVMIGHLPAYVGVAPGGRAEAAGVRTFDRVVRVDDVPVRTRRQLDEALDAAFGRAVALTVVRGETVKLPGTSVSTAEPLTLRVPEGDGPLGFVSPELFVRDVKPESEAWLAGLRPLDRVVELDGAPVGSLPRFQMMLENRWRAKKMSLPLVVQRGSERVGVDFAPKWVETTDPYLGAQKRPELGFEFHPAIFVSEPFAPEEMVVTSYGPGEALSKAANFTYDVTRTMTLGIVGLFTGRISTRSIGSPIMIYQLAGASAKSGLTSFLELFALISINLGLVNLIPIPALDGFHILTSTVEGISRRPVPLRVREVANMVGILFLIALMVLAFTNDIIRIVAS